MGMEAVLRKFAIGLCSILLLSWALAGAVFAASQHIQLQDVPGGMALLDQSQNRITVEVEVGAMDIADVTTQQGDFGLLTASGLSRSYEVGSPNLPISRRLIDIPQGAKIRADVISDDVEEVSLSSLGITNQLMPVQPPLSKSDDPATVPFQIPLHILH